MLQRAGLSSPTSCAPPTAVCRAVHAPAASRRYLTLPSVTYSNSAHDINLRQLQQLYRTVNQHNDTASFSATHRSFFQHWQQLSDDDAQQTLRLLLDKSVAVAAAFVRDAALYGDDANAVESESTAASTSGSSSGGPTGLWGPFAWRQRLPRTLVGFVRASGDHALVATVHDLIVHPELQGFGLGSMLLKRLVQQIADDGVYDVGTVTPSSLQPFFHSCSFDLDRENSVPMALQHRSLVEVETINMPLQQNARLLKLLQQASHSASRSLSV